VSKVKGYNENRRKRKPYLQKQQHHDNNNVETEFDRSQRTHRARLHSIMIFDDVICDKQTTIRDYICMGRYNLC